MAKADAAGPFDDVVGYQKTVVQLNTSWLTIGCINIQLEYSMDSGNAEKLRRRKPTGQGSELPPDV